MKIGLRSVDGTYNMNFGSSLQCFAMYTFLQKLFPKDEILYLSWWSKNQKLDSTIMEKILYGRSMKSTCDPCAMDKCVIGSDCIMYFNECDNKEILDDIFLSNSKVDKILTGYAVDATNHKQLCQEAAKAHKMWHRLRKLHNQYNLYNDNSSPKEYGT